MKVQDFLRLAATPTRTNLFAVAPDDLGLLLLLQGTLKKVATSDDTSYWDASTITKEKARQIEDEARTAPRSGSQLNQIFIYRMQNLPTESVGPLLKAVEEAKYGRFIFQAQHVPRKIRTLMSRSAVLRIPFIPKHVVLGNLRRLNLDAATVDQLGLWDGTITGTTKALTMKDKLAELRREMAKGTRGLASLFRGDNLDSLALDTALLPHLTEGERAYLGRARGHHRLKVVMFLASQRDQG